MTVSNSTAVSGPYTASGGAEAFPFSFQAASATELRLLADGVSVPFIATLNEDGTGSATPVTTLTAGAIVYIESVPDFTQEANFTRFGPYFPDAINAPLDRAVQRDLYLKDRVDRALVFSRDETVTTPPFTFAQLGEMVAAGFVAGLAQLASNIGYLLNRTGAAALPLSDWLSDFLTARNWGAFGENGTVNETEQLRAALNHQSTIDDGSFELRLNGDYLIGSTEDDVILTIQGSTKLMGSSLEGTILRVAGSSTATKVISDDGAAGEAGSGAKIEIYNITAYGADNPALTALFDIGTETSIQFGTYGRLDNLTGRNAPNATAFNLNCNIVRVGDLYSLNTRDGMVSADGGSGCHVTSMYPYGFSRYGTYLGGVGDAVLFGEGEAPTSVDAVYGYGSRSFIYGLGSHIISVAAGTTMKRPWVVDTTYVSNWAMGPWAFLRSAKTQRFGDFASAPAGYTGTATAVGANTLTDTTKTWELDQLKGWAIKILTGPGADNWAEIASNTKDTITIENSGWAATGTAAPDTATTPTTSSTYAVAPALCKASAAATPDAGAPGFASSKVMTLAEAVIRSIFVRFLRAASFRLGNANNAPTMVNTFYCEAALTFGAIPATSIVTQYIDCPGWNPARKQVLMEYIPAGSVEYGMTYKILGRGIVDQLVVVARNDTGATITPPAALPFRALVVDCGA